MVSSRQRSKNDRLRCNDVAIINEFDKQKIVKGIATMTGTAIADTLDTDEQIE